MRKIPLLGLPLSLLLVAALIVAALPMVALAAETETPIQCWGIATIDGVAAEEGILVEIYIGDDTDSAATTLVDTHNGVDPAGTYGSVVVSAGPSRYGEALTYKVNGIVATKDGPDEGVFGQYNQVVNLIAYSVVPPQVTTVGIGDLSDTSATLKGTLDDMGDCTGEVKVWFEYDGFATTKQTMSATGPFSASVSGLSPETDYTFNAKAETVAPCDMATDAGTPQSFATLEEPAWPQTRTLNDGWNVISTPVWLDEDEDADQTDEILSGDWDIAYRWTGTKFSKLRGSYSWEPLEAFYVHVTGTATATFALSQDMMAPNERKLSSNKWALIGPSPRNGTGALTVDEVLAGLNGNWANVIFPATGNYCTSSNDCTLSLPAFGGAWVFVGGGSTRTIVGLYGNMIPMTP